MTRLHAVSTHHTRPVVVVGDSMLDRTWAGSAARLCPDSVGPVVDLDDESATPGGAALTALAAAELGCDTVLVTALGRDAAGDLVRAHLRDAGVQVIDLGLAGSTPEKIRLRANGSTVARADRHCLTSPATRSTIDMARDALDDAVGVILSDYGRGLLSRVWCDDVVPTDTPVLWDPHPRSSRPRGRITLATPNRSEALAMAGFADADISSVAGRLALLWDCTVAVTCGSGGVIVGDGHTAYAVPTEPVIGDACGAGDWFVAGVAHALANHSPLPAAIASGCASAGAWIRRPTPVTRNHTATVVATSGCFDVLHVGHLAMLEHARSLGDRLVVLLNSDDSVRRLKGHGRPVNGVDDRAALLEGLSCVDEVRVFDELTPCAALDRLRPNVFVKGEDYADVHLEERAVMAAWGGRIEFAPLVSGRSTTRVLRLARSLAE